MKKERDALSRELLTDKANYAKIESRINAKQEQSEKISGMVNFLEEKMEAYDTLINESEEAYTKVLPADSDHRKRRPAGDGAARAVRPNRVAGNEPEHSGNWVSA